ncbi:MAG: aminotransferase class III-fold pyridoxal phosphate-dependent enzyme [Chloroflexi bacterium]|nr:aminotransferase class III-fold pyridoxal phosphate-dependent enzyme [Chloroflexota bacterium]
MSSPPRPSNLPSLLSTHLSPAWYLSAPLEVTHGEGCYLYTRDGKRYLDFISGYGVTSTGHCHPRIVEAAREQVGRLIHISMSAFNEPMLRLAERLAEVTPPGLDTMFFSNSGSEAIEAAIKLARIATGRPALIAFQGAFHGRTTGALALTTSKSLYRQGYEPLLPSVYFAPYPAPFRPPNGATRENCAEVCLAELDRMFAHVVSPSQVAAIFVEPILGEGGYIDPPPAFLQGLRRRCDEHGILLVADEIQSGFGRSGKWWAMEHAGVVPDVMCVAKGIASGFPLSAVIGKSEIMRRWQPGAHGTTFGGNPVSCAAALATLDVIESERLVENAAARGEQLQVGLRALGSDYPFVGDVRGKGLMTGIEFVKPDGAPNPEVVEQVKARLLASSVLISRCGPYNQVLRCAPALMISEAEVEDFLSAFGAALDSV